VTEGRDKNLLTFDSLVQDYMRSDLFPPERELLLILRDRLSQMDMLDLGVGAGRTSFIFAALTRTYLGVDYAKSMVEMCRKRFGESSRQKFVCLDAADLLSLDDQAFDLILFSFNGIDCVELERRHKILREVHRLLRSDGYFFFSGHALESFPWPIQWPHFRLTRPLRSLVAFARKAIWNGRRYWANRAQDATEVKKRGWAYLQDGAHSFGLILFYATREHHIRELREHGFEIERRFGLDGRKLGLDESVQDYSIHYLCRKRASGVQ
jgi:SAM-dependent methyltransferase